MVLVKRFLTSLSDLKYSIASDFKFLFCGTLDFCEILLDSLVITTMLVVDKKC